MITLDDIKSQWVEDSKIEQDLLDEESIKIPQLHSKYLNYLSDVRLLEIKKDTNTNLYVEINLSITQVNQNQVYTKKNLSTSKY